MLKVKNITKVYSHNPVVSNISFELHPGEIVGYLGPNGAGKSTTVKMIVGLLEPTSGKIFYKGKDINDNIIKYKQSIGYVPEESAIYSHLSGFEYIQLVGRLRGMDDITIEKKAEPLLEILNVYNNMHFYISSYSKGMKQKILIISALLHNPEILILDEPLSGLDVSSILILKKLLKKLAEAGKIILFSSHILEVIEGICDRVIIIHRGKILANDSVENLRLLSKKPSLEKVFNSLVLKEDTDKEAEKLFDIIVKNESET